MRVFPAIICYAVYLGAIVWPLTALLLSCLEQRTAPQLGFTFSQAQLALLLRTALMSGSAAIAALLFSSALFVFFPRRPGPLLAAALAAGLLCPPMVYAFGWLRIFPGWLDPHVRCVLTWVLWAWPIAMGCLAAGWAQARSSAWQAALLDCSRPRANLFVALPSMTAHILLALALLFVLFFSDYGVPHAFGLRVFATELLAWADHSPNTIDVLWPALLPGAVIGASIAILVRLGRQIMDHHDSASPFETAKFPAFLVLLASLGWIVPIIALAKPLSMTILKDALRTYGADLGWSLLVSLAAAGLVLIMAFGVAANHRLHKVLFLIALLFGALPGALVGEALIAAYNRPGVSWVYNNWPVVTLAYAARFGWIGLFAGWIAARFLRSHIAQQARLDGATESRLYWFVLLPDFAPLLIAVAAIVVALSIGDVAASTLVRVPGYSPISHIIIEKFHKLEDGMLISLSLMLVGLATFGATMVAWALKVDAGLTKAPGAR